MLATVTALRPSTLKNHNRGRQAGDLRCMTPPGPQGRTLHACERKFSFSSASATLFRCFGPTKTSSVAAGLLNRVLHAQPHSISQGARAKIETTLGLQLSAAPTFLRCAPATC